MTKEINNNEDLIDNLEFDEIIYPDNYEEKKKPKQEPKKKSLAEIFANIEKQRQEQQKQKDTSMSKFDI